MFLGIGDRLLGAFEPHFELTSSVGRTVPPHQRVRRRAILGFELQDPGAGLAAAGLHRRLGGLEYADVHDAISWFLTRPGFPQVTRAGGLPGGAGRGERIRTSDIVLPKHALYQTELHPETRQIPMPFLVSPQVAKSFTAISPGDQERAHRAETEFVNEGLGLLRIRIL